MLDWLFLWPVHWVLNHIFRLNALCISLYPCRGIFQVVVSLLPFQNISPYTIFGGGKNWLNIFALRRLRNWSTGNKCLLPCPHVLLWCIRCAVQNMSANNMCTNGFKCTVTRHSVSTVIDPRFLLFIDLLMDSGILSWFGKVNSKLFQFARASVSAPYFIVCSSLVLNRSKREWKTAQKISGCFQFFILFRQLSVTQEYLNTKHLFLK